ncbi:hypothetical protein G6F46_012224 [Rhizopus delemar]|uniref:COPI associated protein n=3 Tax=Rhizopus TaxID=4842 RepID=I1C9S6_RHIO9|nr:hypothetical protein RO3G_09916 [Rhizopus delemar RA 99-880]KAG1454568.1 hypothetical protein G6F55_007538 [Rhizopus delemar]KAG1540369.1 hypothetical protein G6F51_008565 [Rhizopus arrhizus]KAG1493194.1 hypothetical protein G6F54_008760 [Rhizopus delemar]KAG1498568.1 hypothetical protein G6F53_011715 [Rhizopus delemar]|eukprot:EIE85206.1 hypothetical protein RO3G_09916 [Rhizopus delemar RA 99-880]
MCGRFPNLIRVANIIAASLMFAGGIARCINGGFSKFIVGIFIIFFGLITGAFELVLPPSIIQYASFMFSFMGRALFYIFIGFITLDDGALSITCGVIIIVIGIAYVLFHLCNVRTPSNMKKEAFNVEGYGNQHKNSSATAPPYAQPQSTSFVAASPYSQPATSPYSQPATSPYPQPISSPYSQTVGSPYPQTPIKAAGPGYNDNYSASSSVAPPYQQSKPFETGYGHGHGYGYGDNHSSSSAVPPYQESKTQSTEIDKTVV